jgi:hypothetical protein
MDDIGSIFPFAKVDWYHPVNIEISIVSDQVMGKVLKNRSVLEVAVELQRVEIKLITQPINAITNAIIDKLSFQKLAYCSIQHMLTPIMLET